MAQALTRRALAFDLMGACTFAIMEKFHQFLLDASASWIYASYNGAVHESRQSCMGAYLREAFLIEERDG